MTRLLLLALFALPLGAQEVNRDRGEVERQFMDCLSLSGSLGPDLCHPTEWACEILPGAGQIWLAMIEAGLPPGPFYGGVLCTRASWLDDREVKRVELRHRSDHLGRRR